MTWRTSPDQRLALCEAVGLDPATTVDLIVTIDADGNVIVEARTLFVVTADVVDLIRANR